MNFLISFVLLIVATLIGFAFASGYRRRLRFLQNMDSFLQSMLSNCCFLQDSVKRVLDNQKGTYGADFNHFLSELNDNLDKRDVFLLKWQNTQKIISDDEAKFVVDFFLNLGKVDSFTQVDDIKNSKQTLQEKLQDSKQLVNSKGTMSIKLGIVMGIGLFIICI